jgi:hypothetical protein
MEIYIAARQNGVPERRVVGNTVKKLALRGRRRPRGGLENAGMIHTDD